MKMAVQDGTSPVAANQLAAGAFFFGENDRPGFDKRCCFVVLPQALFLVKMSAWDLTSPVAANLAAGAFFGENEHPRI